MIGRMIAPAAQMMSPLLRPEFRKRRFQMIDDSQTRVRRRVRQLKATSNANAIVNVGACVSARHEIRSVQVYL